jgi:hypothetical protein
VANNWSTEINVLVQVAHCNSRVKVWKHGFQYYRVIVNCSALIIACLEKMISMATCRGVRRIFERGVTLVQCARSAREFL